MDRASAQAGPHSLPSSDAADASRPPVLYEAHGLIRDIPLQPHEMTAAVTATDKLFMLAHLGVLRIAPEAWQLTVGGLVDRPLQLRLEDLARFLPAQIEAVHQCAGSPTAPTVATRRVACVVWGGVRLGDILREAGVQSGATHLWSDGADSGTFGGTHVPYFRKDLPLARVDADVLLATRLNGDPLPNRHGGPVRLVVPGFYGTNSVKWLWRLTLADRRADGLFTTLYYNDPLPDGTTRPVYGLEPESIIVDPAPNTPVPRRAEIRGWAWGDAPVVEVKVSGDAGRTWVGAALGPRNGRAWQEWRCPWAFATAGPTMLICRATDAAGRMQPMDGARNEVHRVIVEVSQER
ncbi:oxidoreductase molybdopterin binding (plasmid) [Methylobacterium nodulans ORS 2060]|uniref:Oxidoreductase molybdopterin binding n=2 Tax=Methylobacterium nodulans TaxID=114616 RepID=B8IW35_METNO|nr:oxidoreductase molybdopterin binding [Methylobacterium nodulans ORS 2060]